MKEQSLIVRGIKVQDMELAEVWFPAGARTPSLLLQEIEVMLVSSGSLKLIASKHIIEPGAAILRRLDVNVRLEALSPTRVVSVRAPITQRGADPHRFDGLDGWRALPAAAVDDLQRLHGAMLTEPSEDSLLLEGLALLALSWGEREARRVISLPSRPVWMRKVLERLADLSRTPGASELASLAGVSAAHLSRVFVEHEGCAIGEYQRRLRVAEASRLLQKLTTPLSHIAIAAGFADQAHFSRTFRKYTGMSPSEYRHSLGTSRSREVPKPQLGFDPVGKYPFRSFTADGTPYEGEIEITGSENGYTGLVRTSVMPSVVADSIAIHGRRVVMTGLVPAGVAVLRLTFDRDRFTGEWRVAGKPTRVTGYRS